MHSKGQKRTIHHQYRRQNYILCTTNGGTQAINRVMPLPPFILAPLSDVPSTSLILPRTRWRATTTGCTKRNIQIKRGRPHTRHDKCPFGRHKSKREKRTCCTITQRKGSTAQQHSTAHNTQNTYANDGTHTRDPQRGCYPHDKKKLSKVGKGPTDRRSIDHQHDLINLSSPKSNQNRLSGCSICT